MINNAPPRSLAEFLEKIALPKATKDPSLAKPPPALAVLCTNVVVVPVLFMFREAYDANTPPPRPLAVLARN